jgi:hypothetical protein
MEDVQTSWGLLPRWKARALALAEIQTVVDAVTRNDAAAHASGLGPEDKPPPLAADAAEPVIPPEVLAAIEEKIQELTDRLDAFERMKEAERALIELESRMEAEMPPSQDDDDMALLN